MDRDTETNAAGERTRYTYDGIGNRTQVERPLGPNYRWTYTYDAADRLERVTGPLGHPTIYAYDANDNRTDVTDAKGHLTHYTYDRLNRLERMTYPGGSDAWRYRYDGQGNRIAQTNPNGVTITTDYDALDRATASHYPDAAPGDISRTDNHYDGNGNLLEQREAVINQPDRIETRHYDRLDRLDRHTDVYGRPLSYAYDDAGNRTQRTDTVDGLSTRYGYDALNRNTAVTDATGSTTLTYDRDGRLHEIVRPSGTRSEYGYDGGGRVVSIVHRHGGAVVAEYTYGYDLNGNRITQVETNGAAATRTQYGYDREDRLTEVGDPTGSSTYGLDAVGNREHDTSYDSQHQLTRDVSLSYDARDRLLSASDAVDASTITYSHDANGNRTQESRSATAQHPASQQQLDYDQRDRLIGLQADANPAVEYTYDAQGLRIAKQQGTTRAQYRYDTGSLYAQTNAAGNTQRRYATTAPMGAGARLARSGRALAGAALTLFLGFTDATATPTHRNYLHDALASPIAIEQADGALAQRTRYDAYGQIESEQVIDPALTTSPNTIGFTGYQRDREASGTPDANGKSEDVRYYAKARYYDSGLGAFTSVDPVAGDASNPVSWNRYLYAYANPTVYVDPDGRCPLDSLRCAYEEPVRFASNDTQRGIAERGLAQFDAQRAAQASPSATGTQRSVVHGVAGLVHLAGDIAYTLPEAIGAPDLGSRVRYVEAALRFGAFLRHPYDTTKRSHEAKMDRAAELKDRGQDFEASAAVWEAGADLAQLGFGVQAIMRGGLRALAPKEASGAIEPRFNDIDGEFRGDQIDHSVAPLRATYIIGESDGGPGQWAFSPKYPAKAPDAEFQQLATGAPSGIEYVVATDRLVSGEKWFDGYDPASGRLIDAKNFRAWPKSELPFSFQKVGDELSTSDAIAADVNRSVEVRVATAEKAALVRQIARERGLESTVVVHEKR